MRRTYAHILARRLSRRFARAESGLAAIEAAILFPVLMLMGFGAIDGAMLVQQTHRMEAGLSAAGSYLALGEAGATEQWRARRIAVTGQGDSGGTPVLPSWTEADVTVTIRALPGTDNLYRSPGPVRVATFSSTIPYRGFGILSGITRNSLKVTASHEVRLAR